MDSWRKDAKFVKVAQEMHELSKNIDLKIIKDAGQSSMGKSK